MLNHKITLLQRAAGTDAVGQPVDNWTDLSTIWADVRFQSGAEVLRAGAEVAIKRASIRIRSRADVGPTLRVRYAGEVYDIKSVLPDADRSFVFLVVEAAK